MSTCEWQELRKQLWRKDEVSMKESLVSSLHWKACIFLLANAPAISPTNISGSHGKLDWNLEAVIPGSGSASKYVTVLWLSFPIGKGKKLVWEPGTIACVFSCLESSILEAQFLSGFPFQLKYSGSEFRLEWNQPKFKSWNCPPACFVYLGRSLVYEIGLRIVTTSWGCQRDWPRINISTYLMCCLD